MSAPALTTFAKATVTAGTAVALQASDVYASEVSIKALAANTGTIYIGLSTVTSANGYPLAAGESFSISQLGDIDGRVNLKTIYINSTVDLEAVRVAYIAR